MSVVNDRPHLKLLKPRLVGIGILESATLLWSVLQQRWQAQLMRPACRHRQVGATEPVQLCRGNVCLVIACALASSDPSSKC